MSSDTIKLYHAAGSPNCRRVRIFLADQIPALVERSRRRVTNFYADFDARLKDAPFVAGDVFSAADITMIVTVDFATRAFDMPIPPGCGAILRWYEKTAARPSMTA
jgi:glutathione S-transferase